DLRLTRWGCALARYEDEGWLLTLPAGDDTGPQLVARELRFAPSGRDVPEEAADLLTALTRGARLRPVLRARIEEVTSTVAQRSAGAAAQVRDSRVVAFAGRRIAGRFHDVEVITRSKDTGARVVEALDRLLHGLGAEQSDGAPLLRRALAAAAVEPDVVVHRATKHGSARDAIQRAIAASVLRLLMHDAAVRVGTDPEGVHQARVATRRLRSDLRTFGRLLDAEWVGTLREELKWLGGAFGGVRDTDVLDERLRRHAAQLPSEDAKGVAAILRRLSLGRDEHRAEMLADLEGDRYVRLLDALVDAAANPRLLPEADAPAKDAAPELVRRPWSHLEKAVEALADDHSDEALHQVRIRAKRCRYAAEAVAPLVGKPATRLAAAVANVQTVLGDWHDAVVAEEWLRASVQGGGTAAKALAAGQLIAIERAEASELRGSWKPAWKKASSKKLGEWLR
ncbi:MAG: CHAD domain-containing protein, partial [Actinobacteria bacterium]|nr:CHAD domain-containing protein [Actinomycetota bacterium]